MNGFTAVLDKKPGLISRVFLCLRELEHHVVPYGRQDRSLRQLRHWNAHTL